MKPRSAQLQIRVTPDEKASIQRLAAQAGTDMSSYVLTRVLSSSASQFAAQIEECQYEESTARYGLAELNSFLSKLSAPELRDAVAGPLHVQLTPYIANYVAAMV